MEADVFLLRGFVGADECYVGGKPHKSNKSEDRDNTHKRGRSIAKMPITGIIERNGEVRAGHAQNTFRLTISSFMEKNVDLVVSLLMIDECKGYNRVEMKIKRAVMNHAVRYVSG